MLYYDRTDISEDTDVNKTNESKECNFCHYCYLLKKILSFKQMSTMDAIWFINDVYEP